MLHGALILAKCNIFNQDNYCENKGWCMCRFHRIITVCRLKAQIWAQVVDLHIITGIDVLSLAENRTQIVRFHCINVVDVCPWMRWWGFTVNVDFCTWLWLVPGFVWFHFMNVVKIWLDWDWNADCGVSVKEYFLCLSFTEIRGPSMTFHNM